MFSINQSDSMAAFNSRISKMCDESFSILPPDWFKFISDLIDLCLDCGWIWLDRGCDQKTLVFCTRDGSRVEYTVIGIQGYPIEMFRVICGRIYAWVTREVLEKRMTIQGDFNPQGSHCVVKAASPDGKKYAISIDHMNTGIIQWMRLEVMGDSRLVTQTDK